MKWFPIKRKRKQPIAKAVLYMSGNIDRWEGEQAFKDLGGGTS